MNAGHEPFQPPRGEAPSDLDALAEVFNRFTFDSRRKHRHRRHEGSHQEPRQTEQAVNGASQPTAEVPVSAQPAETNEQPARHIRPYAWTGGRTRSNHSLEMETLVSTSEFCSTARLERLEHHSIASLCQHPRSVAEVGALLRVPLGVTRVLLSDMADLGLITVHQTVSEGGSASHLTLMERVLSGLRRL